MKCLLQVGCSAVARQWRASAFSKASADTPGAMADKTEDKMADRSDG
ncbi:MAG: hypothetical protein HY343_01080 [Lentisphaerae bacterium]|nr:hypothetical protein [Lentisphaerota bacterium]